MFIYALFCAVSFAQSRVPCPLCVMSVEQYYPYDYRDLGDGEGEVVEIESSWRSGKAVKENSMQTDARPPKETSTQTTETATCSVSPWNMLTVGCIS